MKYLITLIVVLPALVLATGCPQPRKAGLADVNYLRDNNPRQSTIRGSELSEPIDPSELDQALADSGRIRTTEDIIADNPALAEAGAEGRTGGQQPPRPADKPATAPAATGTDKPAPAEDEAEADAAGAPDAAAASGTATGGQDGPPRQPRIPRPERDVSSETTTGSGDEAAPERSAQDTAADEGSAEAGSSGTPAAGPDISSADAAAPEPAVPDIELEPLPEPAGPGSPLGNWCVAFRHADGSMEQLKTINAETLEFRANGHFIWRKPLQEDWLKGSWESSGMSLELMTSGGGQRTLNLIMRDTGFMLLEDRAAGEITYCIRPDDDFSMAERLNTEQSRPAGLELELAGPGRWRGAFLGGRGTVELRALGRYLAGTFRLAADDTAAEGFILLEAVDDEWRAWWWDSETLRWPARL